jgi:hypothetical protein
MPRGCFWTHYQLSISRERVLDYCSGYHGSWNRHSRECINTNSRRSKLATPGPPLSELTNSEILSGIDRSQLNDQQTTRGVPDEYYEKISHLTYGEPGVPRILLAFSRDLHADGKSKLGYLQTNIVRRTPNIAEKT